MWCTTRFLRFFFLFSSLCCFKLMAANLSVTPVDFLAAVKLGNLERVNAFLAAGGAVDTRDNAQRTALLVATWANQVVVAKRLIEAGADVNAKDAQQDSPFLVAGAQGRVDILKLTLAHGADLASLNRFGGTALIPACEKGHPEAVRLLIAAGIAVDHVNDLGWNCLLEVVVLGKSDSAIYQDIVKQLIAAKANLNLTDKRGVTAYQYSRRFNLINITNLLASAGAK